MEGYKATFIESSMEVSKKDRINLRKMDDCISLDESCDESKVLISHPEHVIISVHNEKAEGDKDYLCYIIFDGETGTKYKTGSEAFWSEYTEIREEMDGEPFSIEVYKMPSKNYKGKSFITCNVV